MNYVPNLPKQLTSRYADGSATRPMPVFPQNYAAALPVETLKQIWQFMNQKYVFPQIQERTHFEPMWDKMLQMARVQLPTEEMFGSRDDGTRTAEQTADTGTGKARVADSVVHDAIERLTDIMHFVSFKEKLPIQYALPDYIKQPHNTPEYQPLQDRIKAGNALLQWNSDNHGVYRNHLINTRHHFTYGISFIKSDFRFRVEAINRQMNDGRIEAVPEITEIGTTFEPISIRKLWLNWRLPVYAMKHQPCPFFFEEQPRFALLQNRYDPVTNPFGYVNVEKVMSQNYLFNETEFSAVRSAFDITHSMMSNTRLGSVTSSILDPKFSVEAKWTFYPMLPFDPATGRFDHDGSLGIPYSRFIVESFGPNIASGSQMIIRLQPDYYPRGEMPLYGTCHMPDLDSGLYPPSIGQILWNHYKEITKCMEQFLDNKDWINDPPSWVTVGSPALNENLNAKGAKIKVNGPHDFGWRTPYDATGSTVAMVQYLREGAQTTSKAVDAIMGKAMGSRTSATEATNAFQASMSAITTDINLYNYDAMGGYADRVWLYSGAWMDKDLLKEITGQFGFEMTPEDMHMSVSLKADVGSTFIEKITKQQHLRYVLEAGRMDPQLRRDRLWKMLLEEMGFDPTGIIEDNGYDQQIQLATLQCSETYLGMPVIVDPDQDHTIGIKVKSAFIKDRNSSWNQNYPGMSALLIPQIEQHQWYLQLQMQQMLLQQQMQASQAALGIKQEEESQAASRQASLQDRQQVSSNGSNSQPAAQQAGTR